MNYDEALAVVKAVRQIMEPMERIDTLEKGVAILRLAIPFVDWFKILDIVESS